MLVHLFQPGHLLAGFFSITCPFYRGGHMKKILLVSLLAASSVALAQQQQQQIGVITPAPGVQVIPPPVYNYGQPPGQPVSVNDLINRAQQGQQPMDVNSPWPTPTADQAIPGQDPSMVPGFVSPVDGQGSAQNDGAQEDQAASPRRPPMVDHAAAARAFSNDPAQYARQEGLKIGQAKSRGLAHSTSAADQQHLKNWVRHLSNLGFAEEKIMFEARRLDRDSFDRWASRLVWWEQSVHPNAVDVQH